MTHQSLFLKSHPRTHAHTAAPPTDTSLQLCLYPSFLMLRPQSQRRMREVMIPSFLSTAVAPHPFSFARSSHPIPPKKSKDIFPGQQMRLMMWWSPEIMEWRGCKKKNINWSSTWYKNFLWSWSLMLLNSSVVYQSVVWAIQQTGVSVNSDKHADWCDICSSHLWNFCIRHNIFYTRKEKK